VHWDPEPSAKSYEVQTSPDPFTEASWVHRDSVTQSSVTLTGLTRGATYQILVVPVNLAHQTGTGTTATVTVR